MVNFLCYDNRGVIVFVEIVATDEIGGLGDDLATDPILLLVNKDN